MRKEHGITLVSLIITVILIIIIAGTTVYTSVNRFKTNNVSKLYTDIELLNDKINNYYVDYGGLPVKETYTYSSIDFADKNSSDNNTYYIIDLSALGDIILNYGQAGYENANTSQDVYVVNQKTHTVYYVQGIENYSGTIVHTYGIHSSTEDTIPPTKPQIKIVEGKLDKENTNNTDTEKYYLSEVTIEFVPGKDNVSGIDRTTYSVGGVAEQNITNLTNNRYKNTDNGDYVVKAKSYDGAGNSSETTLTIHIDKN